MHRPQRRELVKANLRSTHGGGHRRPRRDRFLARISSPGHGTPFNAKGKAHLEKEGIAGWCLDAIASGVCDTPAWPCSWAPPLIRGHAGHVWEQERYLHRNLEFWTPRDSKERATIGILHSRTKCRRASAGQSTSLVMKGSRFESGRRLSIAEPNSGLARSGLGRLVFHHAYQNAYIRFARGSDSGLSSG